MVMMQGVRPLELANRAFLRAARVSPYGSHSLAALVDVCRRIDADRPKPERFVQVTEPCDIDGPVREGGGERNGSSLHVRRTGRRVLKGSLRIGECASSCESLYVPKRCHSVLF